MPELVGTSYVNFASGKTFLESAQTLILSSVTKWAQQARAHFKTESQTYDAISAEKMSRWYSW